MKKCRGHPSCSTVVMRAKNSVPGSSPKSRVHTSDPTRSGCGNLRFGSSKENARHPRGSGVKESSAMRT